MKFRDYVNEIMTRKQTKFIADIVAKQEKSGFHPICKKCKVGLDYMGSMGNAEVFKCPKCGKTQRRAR